MIGITTYSDIKVVVESDASVGKGPVFDQRTAGWYGLIFVGARSSRTI